MHKTFKPDLVIEATSVCDRACAGCYAPNVVSKESSINLLNTKPSLFLFPEYLALAISELDLEKKIVSIRGGEPTRNPLLSEILLTLEKSGARLYLETHGKWLIDEKDQEPLLRALTLTDANVKISFDSMHGTSAEELAAMVSILRKHTIRFSIAITEASPESFLKSLALLNSFAFNEIYFQVKATTNEALVRPSIGIVGVEGNLKTNLSSKLGSAGSSFQRKPVAV
jgi:organic radical activating enzyme